MHPLIKACDMSFLLLRPLPAFRLIQLLLQEHSFWANVSTIKSFNYMSLLVLHKVIWIYLYNLSHNQHW